MSVAIKTSEYFSEEFNRIAVPAFYASKLSARTKKEYFRNIIHMCNFLCKDFFDITVEDVDRYFDDLRDKSASNKTLRVKLASGVTMEKCIKHLDWNPEESVFRNVKIETTSDNINPSRTPDGTEVARLLEASKDDASAHLIFKLLSRMALSASMIMKLKKSQVRIDTNDDLYIVFTKKDHTEHRMAVPNDIKEELLHYAETVSTEYLFTTRRGNPMKWNSLCRLIEKYRVLAKIETKYTAKDMRNRAFLEQLNAGATHTEIAAYSNISVRRAITLESNMPNMRLCPPEYVTGKQ